MFRAQKWEDLLQKIRDHRIRNNRPVGDPEREVLQYYERNYPFMVMEGKGDPAKPEDSNYRRWRHWVQTIWNHPPKTVVTPKQAGERWAICLECPFNTAKDWPMTDESKEVDRRAALLRRGQTIPERIGYCSFPLPIVTGKQRF